jgi:hypothetical protein
MYKEFSEVLESPKYFPSVSVIIPIESKINQQTELEYKMKNVYHKIETDLNKNYPPEKVNPVLQKLSKMIEQVNFQSNKKSIAIYVSPLMDKIYYLDVVTEEKTVIDDSFEIRDLIYNKKEDRKYFLLILSSKKIKYFECYNHHFKLLPSPVQDEISFYTNDIAEKVTNFSDQSERKEILMDKFLMHADHGLSELLQTNKLSVFVTGADRIIGHFKKITKNSSNIRHYISGNFEESTQAELSIILDPVIKDWQKLKQISLLKEMDQALSHKKLACGIKEVWEAASQKRGRLLIVEKNYECPAQHSSEEDTIYIKNEILNQPLFIKDAVDDVIEKVLHFGGDVEFVDDQMLFNYQHIALIEYF